MSDMCLMNKRAFENMSKSDCQTKKYRIGFAIEHQQSANMGISFFLFAIDTSKQQVVNFNFMCLFL